MILLPGWRRTQRIIASPLIVVPPLLIYLMVMIPIFPQFWAAVSAPDLDGAAARCCHTAHGAAAVWAHLIAFDLFVGRWIYRDSRDRGISPWLISPVLLLTIFLLADRAAGLLRIRALRAWRPANRGQRGSMRSAPVPPPAPVSTAALSPTGRTRRRAPDAPDRSADARWRRGLRAQSAAPPGHYGSSSEATTCTSVVATAAKGLVVE